MIDIDSLRIEALEQAIKRHEHETAAKVVERAAMFHKFLAGNEESPAQALKDNGAIIAEWLKHWPGNPGTPVCF